MEKQSLTIHRLGEFAHSLLNPGSQGKVLATFSEVVYLHLDSSQDELIWLVTGDAPMHRRGMQLSGHIPRLNADTPFLIENHQFNFGSDFVLDFSQSSKWEKPHLHSEDFLPLVDLQEQRAALHSILGNLPAPAGFGIFIPHILRYAQDNTLDCSFPNRNGNLMQRFAWPTIREIAEACQACDFSQILKCAGELIGLGEGLSPSGDDFIGGLLLTIAIRQELFEPFFQYKPVDLTHFLGRSRSRTNVISYTLLKDHAGGHATETVHEFVMALLTSQDFEKLGQLISKVIRMGHSSGWDLLTGILTSMLINSDSKTVHDFGFCTSSVTQS